MARQKRIRLLSEEFEISNKRKIVISEEDLKMAFRSVTSVPVQVLRSAGKKIQEGLAHTRDRLSISTSSITDGDSLVKHFQESIQHLRTHLPSMGSTVHSGDADSAPGDKTAVASNEQKLDLGYRQESQVPSRQRVVFFRRHASDDSDQSLNTFDGNSPVVSDRPNEAELISRVSRLSSGLSFGSNIPDEITTALAEGENEEEAERDDEDEAGSPSHPKAHDANRTHDPNSPAHSLGHRHEAPLGITEKAPAKEKGSKNKKRRKDDKQSRCIIQ